MPKQELCQAITCSCKAQYRHSCRTRPIRNIILNSLQPTLREISTHKRYCEDSGRETGGGYRIHIKRSKRDHNGSIILRSGDYPGQVSSTSNEKAEQECGLPPLESRRKLATIKFTNKLRSYGLDHISRRVFDKWKHSTRLKRSSTLQLDSEIRKELNLDHSSLEFLQEPLLPKNPPKNTCFELELLQPCSKKEDSVTLRQKGLETIAILSQDNFAIAYTDGSSDRSLSNGGAGIILLLPDVTEFDCPRIITSTIARLRTEHLKGMKIHPDKTRSYVQCKHCPDLQLTPNHILECPTVATKLLKMGMVPLRDSLRELLYSPDAPRIAEAVIKTFDGI
ncbi:RNase H domain-containing protein [Trichonephila clavipes]|nr:RNase H domain-containing protein [Trichonephila clavipes]